MPATIRRFLITAREPRRDRPALIGLGMLLLAGLLLRALVVVAWRPGFLGYADSSVYLEAAKGKVGAGIPDSVFFDRLRPAGYPLFLRLLHVVSHDLTFAIVVQHVLGLATAVLLFLAVRRIGGPSWLGLFPTAIVLLGGTEVFAEHGALTESLYIFLQAGALYGALRALDSRDPGWAALSGFGLGLASDVHLLGVLLIPFVAVWLLLARPDSLTGRAIHAATLSAAAALMLGGYVYAQRESIGYTGLTQRGTWNLYGRVAPFADCSKFEPPAGTEVLCESRPPSQRPGPDAYLFASSPATRAFGYPDYYGGSRLASAEDSHKVQAFTRAVILHQPFDYLGTLSREMIRYFFPKHYRPRPGVGLDPDMFVKDLVAPGYSSFVMQDVLPGYYASKGYTSHGALLRGLQRYERWTRIDGAVMIALVLVSLVGPFLATGRLRAGVSLFSGAAFISMITPVATIFFDARLAIPTFGLLGASAALGGCVVWTTFRGSRTV
jgi:hypothetical protein